MVVNRSQENLANTSVSVVGFLFSDILLVGGYFSKDPYLVNIVGLLGIVSSNGNS